jgi:hypothetical protein
LFGGRGCHFVHDVEFTYPLPRRTFAECWVYCLAYKSLQCVAVEFEPDNKDKAVLEDIDKGMCYIQRRSSATIAIAKDAYRHVFMLYSGEGVEALSLMNLPTTMRVQPRLLCYHSACAAKEVNGVCVNTHGSSMCVCAQGLLPTTANSSCVEPGGFETYTPPTGKPRACPFRALAYPDSTSAVDCFCPPGHEYRNTSALFGEASQACVRCEAGSFAYMNSTCQACWNNSWSLPGTVNVSNCLCNMGFYHDVRVEAWLNGSNTSLNSYNVGEDQCTTRVRGTPDNPCMQCPLNSNTSSAGARSIWDCKCNPSHIKIIDPGNPSWFVCAPEDVCREEARSPCPKLGKSVCKSSIGRFEFECQCNPGQGYEDRSLVGGFCLKMWYFNYKVDLDISVEDRQIDMYAIVSLLEITSTQGLKDIVEKSRSKLFKPNQHVVADFSGTLDIVELAFYEVGTAGFVFSEHVCVYIYIYMICTYW